jgi:NADPH:quinone reductase-like Zn-dependent oxidoreductase
MSDPRNRVVQIARFGDPDALEVVDAPLPTAGRIRVYSINAMRARHPVWFREDLAQPFNLLATGAIRPRVAQQISFDEVAEAHRRLEAGGLDGKLVLCPDLPPSSERVPA